MEVQQQLVQKGNEHSRILNVHHGRVFRSHEAGSHYYSHVVRRHFVMGLLRDHLLFEKSEQEEESISVHFRHLIEYALKEPVLLGLDIVRQYDLVDFVRKERL